MVKCLATSPHDPLGITDSAGKNQSVIVSVQYGPLNSNIPIGSMIIGKSRVARDPITILTSWKSNRHCMCYQAHKLRYSDSLRTIVSATADLVPGLEPGSDTTVGNIHLQKPQETKHMQTAIHQIWSHNKQTATIYTGLSYLLRDHNSSETITAQRPAAQRPHSSEANSSEITQLIDQ
ncbi:hypothetical protein F511_02051 [Dorcoceras hygrometricum]|uniref:Uncharacterized protein n=1 Tax=Dorcoceras hygrometricum TaxID=472368 RepID=A0A2Z7C168_9LAMI|nr:hypothetical protein F511_02051 [Dorcoceras hygrometricum]